MVIFSFVVFVSPLALDRALGRGEVADVRQRRKRRAHHAALLENIHVGRIQGLCRVSQQIPVVDRFLTAEARLVWTSSAVHEH